MGRKPAPDDDEGFQNFFDSDFAGLGVGGQDGSNALILESKKTRQQKKELERKQSSEAPVEDKKLSKSQKKRLATLEEQRQKKHGLLGLGSAAKVKAMEEDEVYQLSARLHGRRRAGKQLHAYAGVDGHRDGCAAHGGALRRVRHAGGQHRGD